MTARRPTRTRTATDREWDWGARRPGGTLVPARAKGILPIPESAARHWTAIRAAARVTVALSLLVLLLVHVQPAMALSPPPVPSSEQICGSSILNQGPSSPPGGAVTVPAGDNSVLFNFALPANTTYWFAPGTHTIATGSFGVFNAISPGNNDVLIGAPGAILDGSNYFNHHAFGGPGTNVTIEYLTIQDFNVPGGDGAVQTGQGQGWVVDYDTIQANLPGAGLYLGTDDSAEYDCLTQNGEYGFAAYTTTDVSYTGGPADVVVAHDEISFNDTCNWEDITPFPITPPAGCGTPGRFVGCGCSGAGKFWEALDSTFSDNYVHDDYSAGAWWDTNNAGADIEGNYFADEYSPAIIYEISYNFFIEGNVFVGNGAAGITNPGFPTTAVYINGSGSDPKVPSTYSTNSGIIGNQFYDNWGGVALYETADRFCASIANTSSGECTLVNPTVVTLATCNNGAQGPVSPSGPVSAPAPPSKILRGKGGVSQGQNFAPYITRAPYYSDCRWKTQNVTVSGNLFDYTPGNIPGCTFSTYCGFNGLFSNYGVTFPYYAYTSSNAITYTQNDLFSGNTYCGPWEFDPFVQGNQDSFAVWQAGPAGPGTPGPSPYDQDPGSTLNGPSCSAPVAAPVLGRGSLNRPVVVPIRIGR